MLLIGFGHKARQGKDTAAVAMINASHIDARARIFKYADALRLEVSKLCREYGGAEQLIRTWHEVPLRGVLMPAWVGYEMLKPRLLLQWYGTDYRRAADEDYWVKRLDEQLAKEQPDVALITDVRFPNECEHIHRLGGYLVKVTRTTPPDLKVPEHASEKALDGYTGWDYQIASGSLKDLHKQAADIYRKIVKL
jgi:hypothetical protein